jgi:hypothetical protein
VCNKSNHPIQNSSIVFNIRDTDISTKLADLTESAVRKDRLSASKQMDAFMMGGWIKNTRLKLPIDDYTDAFM